MALTKKQLEWARRVYSPKGVLFCHFPIYTEKQGWGYCGSTIKIEINHVKPQGWTKRILKKNPDYPTNLVAICKFHHVGWGYQGTLDWENEVVFVIHTDTALAYRQYRDNRSAFEEVFADREVATDRKEKYWNTDWDSTLTRIAHQCVSRYLYEHPRDPFPKKR